MASNSHVILNPEDHSIGNLPEEILRNIFNNLRGNNLINISTVSKSFNETIGRSKKLMDKIRLRVSPHESRSFTQLEEVLQTSLRKYEHIAFMNLQCDDRHCLDFIRKRSSWKSLKISTCHFETNASEISFLSMLSADLEEIDLDNVIIDQFQGLRHPPSTLSVTFRKLLKLKCGILPGAFVCSTLKALDMCASNESRMLSLLQANPSLENLTMTYEVLDAIFRRNVIEAGVTLRLKKLQLIKNHGTDQMDSTSSNNFQTFLKSQSDSVEEVVIDWFSGPPPEAKSSSPESLYEFFPEARRVRGRGHRGIFMGRPRRRFPNGYDPRSDICVRSLAIIFQDFTAIRKLIVADKQGLLLDTECPTAAALNLVSNFSITELRLRFEKSPFVDTVIGKLVAACPNMKSLFVHEMDQQLLVGCANELVHLESIFALSLKLNFLPSDAIKFVNLQRLSFCECVVDNHPEWRTIKSAELKKLILELITKKRISNGKN